MAFVTRFAPSPTGPLHLGHAYSAMLAHDMARAANGTFLLRMEDIDTDRCLPEHEAGIVEDLSWLGVTWDGPIARQSTRLSHYAALLEPLAARGLLYPCSCTRGAIRAALSAPQEGAEHRVYPGTCRGRPLSDRTHEDALRLDLGAALREIGETSFVEAGLTLAGTHEIRSASAEQVIGDVVLARKGDGVVAYFLASAIDDADQGISHVVRGEDLFAFTPVQVILLRLLGLPTPIYYHHPLIRDEAGKRLAKRDDARALSRFRAEGATPADIRRMVGL